MLSKKRDIFFFVFYSAIFLALLITISLYNYLLYHLVVELFTISVAVAIFFIVWNSQEFAKNSYMTFVGIAFLFIGSLDLVHAISYKGVGIFDFQSANIATQLWIAARYMHAGSFLIAPIWFDKKIKKNLLFLTYMAITALIFLSIFTWKIFPACYIEGYGLTFFKNISEIIICAMFVASAAVLVKYRERFEKSVLLFLLSSLFFSVISEIVFTFYTTVTGTTIFIGHLFKVISFYLLYRALIRTQLINPYDTLFKGLKSNEIILSKTLEAAKSRTAEIETLLSSNRAVLTGQKFENVARSIINDCLKLINAESGSLIMSSDFTEYYENVFVPLDNPLSTVNKYPRELELFLDEVKDTKQIIYKNNINLSMAARQITNIIAAPLIITEKIAGFVICTNDNGFTLNDKRLISGFVELLSISLRDFQNTKAVYDEYEKRKNILEAIPDGIYIVNRHHEIEYINPVMKKMFGPINNQKCYQYLNDKSQPCDQCLFPEINDGKTIASEYHCPKNNRIYDVIEAPFHLPGTDEPSKIKIIRDVTEQRKMQHQIAHQKELLENTFDNIPVLLVTWDPSFERFELNKFAQQVTGWNNNDANQYDFMEKVYPDPHCRKEVYDYMQNFQKKWKLFYITAKDGTQIPVNWSNIKLTDQTRIGIGVDMREIIEAQENLMEKQQTLEMAQNAAGLGVFDYDIINNSIKWDQRVRQIWGIGQDDSINFETFLEGLHPDDRPATVSEVEKSLDPEGEGGFYAEYRVISRNNGNLTWVAASGKVYFEGGKPFRMIGIIEDITSDKKREQQIENLARFPSENPFPVLRISKDGVILYSNNSGKSLLDFWQRQTGDIIPEDWRDIIDESIKAGQIRFKEAVYDNSYVSFAITPITDGEYVNIYGRDMTEFRNTEKKLHQINIELESRVRDRTFQLQKTVDVLQDEVLNRFKVEKKLLNNQEKLRALSSELIVTEEKEKRKFALILHDSIGQLLAFAKKQLGIIINQSPDDIKPSLEEVWDLIKQSIQQTRNLTFDLSSQTLYTLGLNAAIEELVEDFAMKDGYTIHYINDCHSNSIPEELRILIYRSVRELLINISKHANANHVSVQITNPVENQMQIIVSDNGKGFDISKLDHQKGKLHGYGLFSLKERVTSIGGSVDIISTQSKGAKIIMIIPEYK